MTTKRRKWRTAAVPKARTRSSLLTKEGSRNTEQSGAGDGGGHVVRIAQRGGGGSLRPTADLRGAVIRAQYGASRYAGGERRAATADEGRGGGLKIAQAMHRVEEALIEIDLAGVSVRRVEDSNEVQWGTQ